MIKRLFYLNGIAILAVVLNHAAGFGQMAMFLWPHRYLEVTSPNWDQLGSLTYYFLLIIRQLCVFSVPAFLFISGFFISYAARGNQNTLTRKVIFTKILYLLIPYAIWSLIVFLMDYFFGETYTPIEYLRRLLTGGALGLYFFIPVLCWLYLLSPLIVNAVKANWKLTLIVSFLIQLITVSFRYFSLYKIEFPGLDFLLGVTPFWSPFIFNFFFVLGVIIGLRLSEFRDWVTRSMGLILTLLPITAILNIIEADYLLQSTQEHWGAYQESITFHLYGISAILVFLGLAKLPYIKKITVLSNKTYGIYLSHMIIMTVLAKFIYHYAPQILSYQLIFMLVLFTSGLGIPLLSMKLLEKTPARKYYRYIFG
jgi:surface polysaccharide O-acyltransferase-like enzyme